MASNEKRFCPNNILEARNILDMSQKEVALSLSVSAPSVSDWERCLKYPSVENLLQLADLFEMSTDYLLRRTNRTTLSNTASPDWNGDLLRTLRSERNETVNYAAEAIGVSVQLYQDFEDSRAEPSLSDLIAIAEHFGTSYDELLRRNFSPTSSSGKTCVDSFHISPEEQHLIEIYRRLNPINQASINERALTLLEQEKFTVSPTASGE